MDDIPFELPPAPAPPAGPPPLPWWMDFYDRALAELEAKRKRIEALKPAADLAFELALRYDATSVSVSVDAGCLQGVLLSFSVTSLKDLVPVRRAVRAAGFRLKTTEDYAELGRRRYEYGDIQVMAFVPTALEEKKDAKCRFVQAGVKEVPIYKLVCEDDSEHDIVEEPLESPKEG